MNKTYIISEDQLELMHTLECNFNVSQRYMANKTGLSIGKVNYCLKELIDIGFIRVDNISKSNKKINYAFI